MGWNGLVKFETVSKLVVSQRNFLTFSSFPGNSAVRTLSILAILGFGYN